jgi:hypothetical protein
LLASTFADRWATRNDLNATTTIITTSTNSIPVTMTTPITDTPVIPPPLLPRPDEILRTYGSDFRAE